MNEQNHHAGMKVDEVLGRYRVIISDSYYYIAEQQEGKRKHLHKNAHSHENFFELVYVLSGTGKYIHGDTSFSLSKGDLFLADPHVLHQISSFETIDLCILWFEIKIVDSHSNLSQLYEDHLIQSFLKNHQVYSSKQSFLSNYFPLLTNNAEKSTIRKYGIKQATRNFVFEGLECLCGEKVKMNQNGEVEGFFDASLHYIDQHLNEKITVPQVSSVVGTSERNLRRLFQKYLHSSVIYEINRRKMNYACHLLISGTRVNEISEYLKYPDPFQFSKTFKKYYFISPKKYQKKYAANQFISRTDFLK